MQGRYPGDTGILPVLIARAGRMPVSQGEVALEINWEMNMRNVEERSKALIGKPCCNDDQLHDWLMLFLGIRVPRRAVCDGHCATFDYIRAA